MELIISPKNEISEIKVEGKSKYQLEKKDIIQNYGKNDKFGITF
jgi:hypothetical protein